MRKMSRKFLLAVAMCALLVYLAVNWAYTDFMCAVLFALAALVACVWMACEARIDCAAAPLNLPPETMRPAEKPPDQAEK